MYLIKRELYWSLLATLVRVASSHGCVKFFFGDANWLFQWAKEGDWVYVWDPSGETRPTPVSMARVGRNDHRTGPRNSFKIMNEKLSMKRKVSGFLLGIGVGCVVLRCSRLLCSKSHQSRTATVGGWILL
jgi:hypothetical protein